MALSTCYNSSISKYEEFIIKNPFVASELEALLKWCSYLTAGRFTNSSVISELIYSASSLLTLFNDLILRHASNIPVHFNKAVSGILTCLMVVEYSEVFAELSAFMIGGDLYRWVAISFIQIIKSGLRLLLLLKHGHGISKSPTIVPLNRRKDLAANRNSSPENQSPNQSEAACMLKRSGRTLRMLENAPPLSRRNWKPPNPFNESLSTPLKTKVNFPPTQLAGDKLLGEILHVLRPVAHLIAIAAFGKNSWKPWVVALGCDMTSLQLLGGGSKLNRTEQPEMNRRALVLLMYLLRSPFYDRYTKQKSTNFLKFLGQNIPLVGRFILPLSDYLPEWQKTYCHAWSI